MSAFLPLLRSEARLLARSAGSMLWTALVPIAALVVIALIPAVRARSAELGGISYLDAYLPILMIFSLCMSTVNLLPPTLALYRERGILRRLSTTPVPPSWLLGAQACIYAGLAILVAGVLALVAVFAYDVRLPHQVGGFVLALLLVAAATTGIGVLVAALVPSGKAANAVSLALFFPLMFFAGLWIPRAKMPAALRAISDYTPLGAGVRAVQDAIAGHWPATTALLVLAGYAVCCAILAARAFRWD
jgi:ABC-2 type transport system permease protein